MALWVTSSEMPMCSVKMPGLCGGICICLALCLLSPEFVLVFAGMRPFEFASSVLFGYYLHQR